jgi:cytochrome c-type biogenesis protein CcmH
MTQRWRRWLPWLVLVAVAIAALVVGTHRSSPPASLDARVMHIATEVRCPVCEGQSAAQSQAAASIQIRNQIRQELTAGESEGQILAGLVGSYGPSILEKPQATGVGVVVWVVPVLAVLGGIGGLALAFRRWRLRMAAAPSGPTEADRQLVDEALRFEQARRTGEAPA